MLRVLVDEQATGLNLFTVQTHDEVKVYSGSDQLTGHDVWVALQVVEPLPGRPRGAHWRPYEHKGLLGSEQPECSGTLDGVVEVPWRPVGRVGASKV